ncbi:DNA topoisomerase I [Candidatus Bathyarchaeota archaeon]|nr:DNA topoisomerase I [Candidatus Bathyarchaeota archaeon]
MKELIHNGVLIPELYKPKGFSITFKGEKIKLNAEQEEMAVAWVKKLETPYVKDEAFVKNFFKDFVEALNLKGEWKPEDFDFSEVINYVEAEKKAKEALTKEERKKFAEQRKLIREANKAKYGYAIVDGERVEIANYTVEPSSIFMGRGKHPLRGRWKPGAKQEDITLNLSPNAPIPEGRWKEIVWDPDSMWVARWKDKLTGKMKYVWLSDSSPLKQAREKEKFDKAKSLDDGISEVRKYIWMSLSSDDVKQRKIATVCYLIDALKFRVGDEKDEDEADTVGAATLRPEHVKIKSNGKVLFKFLGKDSVEWRKEVKLPSLVINNLKEFIVSANSSIFDGVKSEDVNAFLNEVMPGLTAKVFRTYHGTRIVEEYLESQKVNPEDPEYIKKFIAKMANLQAAVELNHKKAPPKNWREILRKKEERLEKLKSKKLTKKRKEAIKKLKLQIKLMKETNEYNLNTSLKSYIDPRVYYEWCKKINFNWKLYYSKTLQKKFSWVEEA